MSNRKQRKPLPYSPHHSYSSMREQGSPTKASVLLQQDNAQYIQSLVARKETFCTCLDLYKLAYENQLPQKCLIHNNFITLYCQNEFKLLCVNCIYGSAIHKDHRVIPSKNSIANIAKDNEDNLRTLEEELQKIKHIDIELKKNKKMLEDEYKVIVKQIDDQFKQIYQMIEKKQASTRQRVNEAFARAMTINDKGIKEMGWWKDILAKTKSTFPKASLHEETETYKHLVLDLFKQQKIDDEKLTYLPSGQEIRTQFLKQVTDLKQSVEQHTGTSYQTEKSKIKMF